VVRIFGFYIPKSARIQSMAFDLGEVRFCYNVSEIVKTGEYVKLT